MKPKHLYLVLCGLGIGLPYWQFLPWMAANGLNLPFFFHQLFANRIGGFFAMDVVVSALALMAFTQTESRRLPAHGRWLIPLAILTVGVSLGLPLLLYLREVEREAANPTAAAV